MFLIHQMRFQELLEEIQIDLDPKTIKIKDIITLDLDQPKDITIKLLMKTNSKKRWKKD
jgi:hypothetical protein